MKRWINVNVPIEAVRLAEEAGHKVVFTPPYHSDLQPIELLWARVKGNVGRQYTVGTTLEMVYERLLQEFDNLETPEGEEAIGKMIESCKRTSEKLFKDMDLDDPIGDDDPTVELASGDNDDGVASDDSDDSVVNTAQV